MTQRYFALIIFLFAGAVILAAWSFEVIGGYQPCGLCLQQRIPYYVGIPIAALSVFAVFWGMPPMISKILLLMTGFTFAISLFLAIRHAGVEWDWWLGPSNCGAGSLGDLNGGSLLDAVKNTKIVFCDESAARFLGLSFAGWNAIASLILIILSLRAAVATRTISRS